MELRLLITLDPGHAAEAVAERVFEALMDDDLELPGVATIDGYDFKADGVEW